MHKIKKYMIKNVEDKRKIYEEVTFHNYSLFSLSTCNFQYSNFCSSINNGH